VIWAGTLAPKAGGPVALGGRRLPAGVAAVVGPVAPALLAALVAYESLTGKQRAVDDARLVGVPAASIAVAGRLPLIAVVTLAALTTALARPF
jgi:uncharacterized membrane protein